MTVRIVKSGKWCERGVGPVINFEEGQIYNGLDQSALVKHGWAESTESPNPGRVRNTVLKQIVTRALSFEINEELFVDSAGEDMPRDSVFFGDPINTQGFTSTYFVFDTPNMPEGAYRAFQIYHSHDPDGGFEKVDVENLIYGSEDGRFPVMGEKTADDSSAFELMREGIVNTRQWVKIGVCVVGELGGSVTAVAIQDPNTYPVADNRAWFESATFFAEGAITNDEPDAPDSSNETFEDIILGIVEAADTEAEAKDKIVHYLKGVMPDLKIDKRKKLNVILKDIGVAKDGDNS